VITHHVDGSYRFVDPDSGVEYHVERLRRDTRGELVGKLSVSAGGLLSARTTDDDVLCAGSFNFSFPRARDEWARRLGELARTGRRIDFRRQLEQICGRLAKEEREAGDQPVILREVGGRPAMPMFELLGLRIPKEHPSSLFGPGDSLKSWLACYLANEQARAGVRVAICDYEMDRHAWRERQARIDPDLPDLLYVRCDRPIVHDVDRLRRIFRTEKIEWSWFDSAAYLTEGKPEDAVSAMAAFRAFRQIGIPGGNIIAHSRREDGDGQPFGSVFWHNSFRATFNVKRASTSADGKTVQLGIFPRKFNLGPHPPAIGLRVTFDGPRVYIEPADVAMIETLADSLPLWQRVRRELHAGPETIAALAGRLCVKPDSVEKAVKRRSDTFVRVMSDDGIYRFALVDRRAS
jgi:hypothetical protein